MKIKCVGYLAAIICLSFSAQTWADSPSIEADKSGSDSDITEILVTGALSPMGLDRLGKPVSIITHAELQERSEPTVGELLSSEPGVSSTYFGPGASRPIIRGQSKQRVRMLENGLESGDVSDVSDDHAVGADPITLKRIDVLRGPSTLLYGSSAIGGVVNMIDESIAEEAVGKALTGEIDLRKGDPADDESTGAAALNGQLGTFNWHFSGFSRETENIEIPGFAESERLRELEEHEAEADADHDAEHAAEEEEVRGKLENSDSRTKGLKVGGSHVWDDGYFGLAVRTLESKYGIPGGHHHHEGEHAEEEHASEDHEHSDEHHDENSAEEAEVLPRIDLEQFRLESRGEVRFDEGFFEKIRFGGAYSKYEHSELEGDQIATKFDKDSYDGRVELTHRHEDDFEGGAGLQIRYDDFKASGEEAFLPPSTTFAPAFFAVEDFKISKQLVWQLGGRYEYTDVDADAIGSQQFNMLSASTGFVRNLDQDGVYTSGLTFAYNERAPTATELFANGAHLATQTFEVGDQNLEQETSAGVEIVLHKNSGRVTGQTSLFLQQYSDYINLTASGEEDDGIPVYLYEMDRARFWGFESELEYQLFADDTQGMHLYGQIDYVRGENLSSDDSLPRITPLRAKVGMKYQIERASAYVENTFVAKQDRTAEFELPTDNYSLLNFGVAYQLPSEDQNTYELYARGTNLTDEEARVHTSFLKDVVPLRGRAFFAGLKIAF